MGRLDKVNSKLYCLGIKVIHNNKINKAATILDLAVKRAGVNIKQYKGQSQMDKCWFDDQRGKEGKL
jgi:hypothetical protein